jgi:hypothetical protein
VWENKFRIKQVYDIDELILVLSFWKYIGKYCNAKHQGLYRILYFSGENPELERVSEKFHKYDTKILLGDSNAEVGREDILKPTIWN